MFYCSEACQYASWLSSHKLDCPRFSEKILKAGAKLPPKEPINVPGKYRKAVRTIQHYGIKIEELERKLKEAEAVRDDLAHIYEDNLEVIKQLKDDLASIREDAKLAKKGKAGKSSALMRLKRKFDEIDENIEPVDETHIKNKAVQTVVTIKEDEELIKVVGSSNNKLTNIDVVIGKGDGRKSYGENVLVRLPSTRSSWPNDKVSTRAVQGRAAIVGDFVSLISGSSISSFSREDSDQIDSFLYLQLIKQNKDIFTKLLRSSSEILGLVMKMTPEETSKFMHASNSSYSSKRKMATMFGKIFGFNPLASEKQQRFVEKEEQKLIERSKLEHGTILLRKTAHAEFSTLCAFVRVSDLSRFFAELFLKAQAEESVDLNSMRNLDHPLFFNKLWIIISGDKGASTMKFVGGVGGKDPHLFGIFEASDTPENLLTFQSKYREQIGQLVTFGLTVSKEDGSSKVLEVEVILCGDKAFLSDENGHAGGAASFPSIYRLVTSQHLRKKHLDGSPHNKSNPECQFPERTPEDMAKDYHENLSDR